MAYKVDFVAIKIKDIETFLDENLSIKLEMIVLIKTGRDNFMSAAATKWLGIVLES